MTTAAVLPLVASEQATDIATPSQGDAMVLMFERLATDPRVDVDKLERLIEMQRGIVRENAKAAFNAAYAQMQSAMPLIEERGQIAVKGTVRSTYAKLEDIHEAIKPVLHRFGFALRHRTEWPADREKVIRIVGILSHEQGHAEESAFEAPMDRSEFRTDIQSMGSTVSYGRRYTTLDLLNIATKQADDDGRKAGRPQPPDGYDAFDATLPGVVAEGSKALEQVWAKAKPEFKSFMVNHAKERWAELKRTAGEVDQRKRGGR